MKSAAIVLTVLSLATAGAAAASERVTDIDYLKANRCRGLAAGLGVGDTASLDVMLKTEGRSRSEAIRLRGEEEMTRARRDAAKSDIKERLTAEVNGPCVAYMGGLASGKSSAASH
jgi:hypothetical protein